jgi:hypothetical protein
LFSIDAVIAGMPRLAVAPNDPIGWEPFGLASIEPCFLSVLPLIAGREAAILELVQPNTPLFLSRTRLKLEAFHSSLACAHHMHQPTIPATADGTLISHLPSMLEQPGEGDNHKVRS